MKSRLLHLRLLVLSLGITIISTVAAVAQSISFTSDPYPTGADEASAYLNVAYIYHANAEADNGGGLRYSLRFGPSGMTVDSRTGVVGWQPTGEGEFDAEIRAELVDNPSVNTTQTWKIVVSKTQTHPGCTGNEAWLTVERGLPGAGIHAALFRDELYVLHATDGGARPLKSISKWNGSFWSTVGDLSAAADSITEIIAFNDELYAATSWGGIEGVANTSGIARWDGTSWSGVGTHNIFSISEMLVFEGALYGLAQMYTSQSIVQVLVKWDGATWEIIYEGNDQHWGYPLTTLVSENGKLYAVCAPGTFGLGYDDLPLLELKDGTLTPVDNRDVQLNDVPYYDAVAHNGSIILLGSSSMMRWDGTKAEEFGPWSALKRGYTLFTGISYDGQFYIAAWDNERGLPAIMDYEIWRFSNDGWHPVSALQGMFVSDVVNPHMNFIEYNGDLYSYGHLTQSCQIALNGIAVLGTEDECARISGSVYHDDNRNCAVDGAETALEEELIEILPGPLYTMTTPGGTFTTLLRPGTYTVRPLAKRNWTNPCADAEITLASPAAAVSDLNLGVDMIPGIYDVQSSLMIGRPRPGFDFTYTLTYWNTGTESATGKVIFEYDNRLAYQSSTTEPTRRLGNIFEWDFADLPIGESVSITITMSVPTSMSIGTELCALVDVQLERKDDEEFLDDNRDSICTTVTGAYDPNDIQVAPRRFDEEFDDAPLLPGDTVLSYFVRFQNTGTDTAFTVIVKDTLDPALLDVVSIRLGAASHDFDFNISGSGILTWTFNNILLPDSNVNELASHGYFKYMVHLRRGLTPMTQIPNRASIYFDYNEPVLTNTVVSITSGTLSVGDDGTMNASLRIYPNPVQGASSIELNLTEREHVSLRLIDSKGDLVAIITDKEMNAGEHTLSLNGRELSAGAYYLVLDRGGMKEIYPVVVNR